MDVRRFLIALGLVILVAGIAWPILSRIGLGRLPGDIVVRRGELNRLRCSSNRVRETSRAGSG